MATKKKADDFDDDFNLKDNWHGCCACPCSPTCDPVTQRETAQKIWAAGPVRTATGQSMLSRILHENDRTKLGGALEVTILERSFLCFANA